IYSYRVPGLLYQVLALPIEDIANIALFLASDELALLMEQSIQGTPVGRHINRFKNRILRTLVSV
ncbi:hypothetical protein V7075_28845, partial [Neobacillus drentensis]|uniref:hypothetical protein n=1 Tax=Neobacillus drentensis TaxID=220684 RepID=UPI002FFD5AA9